MSDQSAVRYERDSDGVVTLTLDDPNASANTSVAREACTTVTTKAEETESATLKCLRGVVGRGSRSGGDKSRKSESVVDHFD